MGRGHTCQELQVLGILDEIQEMVVVGKAGGSAPGRQVKCSLKRYENRQKEKIWQSRQMAYGWAVSRE